MDKPIWSPNDVSKKQMEWNSVDPDQISASGAHKYGSTVFPGLAVWILGKYGPVFYTLYLLNIDFTKEKHHNNPKYWEIQAWENCVDPEQMLPNAASDQGLLCLLVMQQHFTYWYIRRVLTPILLNPDIPCLCKQCRSRSVGLRRSQLIWTCTVCHYVNL